MNNFVVYKHVFPNGKVYIGITCCEPAKRWKSGYGYKNQTIMNNAIRKYGWKNIKHIIVARNLTKEAACEMEVALIREYNSADKKHGYNTTLGGDHYEMTESHKAKISAANKGKPSRLRGVPMSESHRQRIGNANRGKKRTEEQRQKQSEYMRNHISSNGNPRAQKVLCIEKDVVFDSVKSAAEWAGVPRTTLSDALNGRSKTCCGMQWCYLANRKKSQQRSVTNG